MPAARRVRPEGRSWRSARSRRMQAAVTTTHVTSPSGFRRTHLGTPIPRDIITTFVCLYNGVEVFRAELHPSISANPYIQFSTVATESGTLEFRWSGDNGFTATQTARISVA